MKRPEIVIAVGNKFGLHLHTIETANVDDNHKNKAEDMKVAIPAKFATIKSVKVASVREIMLPGGIPAVSINGGEKELRLGLNDSLIEKASSYREPANDSKQVFGNYAAAEEIANAVNVAERARLTAIRADLDRQIETLTNIIESNTSSKALYVED